MCVSPAPGIRDRKRAETQARIEAAATSLVLRDGLAGATVDAISERADISPRTFFNYFESKDSALLGLPVRCPDDDLLGTDPCGADEPHALVTTVVRMVLAVMGAPASSLTSVHRERMEVIRRHPELIGSQFSQLTARKEQMAEAVRLLLTTHPDFGGPEDSSATGDRPCAARAEVVLALCGSAARAALHEWADLADPDPADPVHLVEQRAVALVADTIRRLA